MKILNFLVVFLLSSVLFVFETRADNQIIKISDYDGPLWGLRFLDQDNGFVLANGGKIYKTIDGGQSWNFLSTVATTYHLTAVCFIDENIGFVVGQYGFIAKTTNGGINWVALPTFTIQQLNGIRCYNNEIYAVGCLGAFFRSLNQGATWISLVSGFQGNFYDVAGDDVYRYGVSENSLNAFWKSSNNGGNWSGYNVNNYRAFGVAFNQGTIHIIGSTLAGDPITLHSSDNGSSWQSTNIPTGVWLKDISFLSNSGTGFIIAGNYQQSGRVYKTTNNGVNWSLFDQNSSIELYSMECISNSLIVTGDSGTIYRYDAVVGISSINSTIPNLYHLSQNYPNPFNPETKINFSLPEKTNVKLVIYDITGKEIKTLVNEVLPVGNYQYDFNANNLTTGTYFYRLETNNFIKTKKMMLIK